MKRAVFLDRDGVLNVPRLIDGKPHPPMSVADTQVYPDARVALDKLKVAGFQLAVITNQPDVARGTQTREAVNAINTFVASCLPFDHFETCFHDDGDGCDCRKPLPGLIFRAAAALDVPPELQFVVGDRWRDIDAGRAARCRTVWIDRLYLERQPHNYDFRAESISEAVEWILTQVE